MKIYYEYIDDPYFFGIYDRALDILVITINPEGKQGIVLII